MTLNIEEARWKRETHKEHGTKLIETYSWQFRKGTLESTLEQKLQDEGVTFKPVPPEELVKRLSSERLSRLSHLLGTFLTHVKSSNLDHEEILARAKGQKDKDRAKCFLEIFRDVREGYEKLLQAENAVDFHDLINKAAAIIADGSWVNPFQYVLIDEFQDISNGRMNLAKALRKPGMAYFLVGDDWQSIYRFAGSYVGLIHQTADHLGFTQQQTLTTTFRFGDGVLRPSTGFVQQNPEQTNRQLHAHSQEGDQGITVMPADLPETGLHEALREIEETRESPQDSVLVLGRYRASRRILGQAGRNFRNVQFNTVHSTKGQEADYVIVLDLKDDQYGVPLQGRGRPAPGHRDATNPRGPVPLRRREKTLLRGPDQGQEGRLPDHRPGQALSLRERTGQELPGGQGQGRAEAPVSGMRSRFAHPVAEWRESTLLELPQVPAPGTQMPELQAGLREPVRGTTGMLQSSLRIAAADVPEVPDRNSAAPDGALIKLLGMLQVPGNAAVQLHGESLRGGSSRAPVKRQQTDCQR